MCHYTHLSPQERDCIAVLCGTREGQSAISRQRSAGTAPASATSSRGTHATDTLRHVLPKRRADERRRRCRAKRRLSDPALAQKVRLLIMDRHWSPEQIDDISGSRVAAGASLSLSTIYREVHAGALDLPEAGPEGQVQRHLRRKGKQVRRKRPKIRGKIRISHTVKERPKQADERSRLGDWEDDTVVAAGPVCLLVLADRASRLLLAKRCHHDSGSVSKAEVGLLQGRPLETLTPDRGKEFAGHADVTKALGGVQFYFCDPHHLWQKPTVKNTNGLLLEFFS
ncbi:MAG: IS30 family transposase [Coriobacteriaceae bacterium]|nr:MAG: IS30 family transposase [Coriobacteriaceae bacterium]